MFHTHSPIVAKSTNSTLFRLFPNYAGVVNNQYGEYPVSYLELSRPTGKYVSRLLLRELNLFIRRHSIIMIGNTCAPGYFFPKIETDAGVEQFQNDQTKKCGVFIANVEGDFQPIKNAVVFEAEPFMVLNLKPEWASFDDYLNEMTSKYRIRAKKVYELSAQITVKEFNGDHLSPGLIEKCSTLLAETLKEKTLLMNKNLGGIIARFGDHFGSDFKVRVYYLNEEPVGFISYSVVNNGLNAWHVGYEAELAKSLHIYQRMLYDLVNAGIQLGCDTIHFGRTATEIKSTLGAEPQPNQFVVYIKSGILRALLNYYKKRHYRPKEYKIRRPFR